MSLLERPIARAAIAAVILAILALGVVALNATRGGSAKPQATAGEPEAPLRAATTDEAGIGPIGDSAPIINRPAPDFALRSSDGKVIRLSDLRGSVVWVNFWASWCVPCKKELPDIQKLYDEKHAAGLEVLAVNYQEDAATASGFFSTRSLTLPLLLDTSGSVYNAYRLQGLPDSFFVDRDGNVSGLQFGFLTEAKMRERLAAAGLP